MKNVLITGGTGLVGSNLSRYLSDKGYVVAHLSRSEQSSKYQTFLWDYNKGFIDAEAIEFADVIIHLAGENISKKRWTKRQKQVIIDSRVKTSLLLKEAIIKSENKPNLFISASAIGFYGTYNSEDLLDEQSVSGNDFLADVVVQWESAVDEIKSLGIPLVKMRTGVVMDSNRGAFPEMTKSLKYGFVSYLGSGKQYVPWVSSRDLSRAYEFIINQFYKNGLQSEVYNAVAPEFINNKEMTKQIAKIFGNKPVWFVPAFIIKLLFGQMSCILLYGTRISSKLLSSKGFEFKDSSFKDWLNEREN